jgi:hypothetical protein
MRRRSDFYVEIGKFAGLIGAVCVAIIGQAELVGEPWRHYITVTAVVAVAVWGYCMHPQTLSALGKAYRLMRAGKMTF